MATSTHHGSCHCGAVQYSVDIDLEAQPITCNCSICGRTGAVLSFVPANSFHLEKGEDHLQDYQFNKHVIHHLFCKTCGVRSFARGEGPKGPTVAVNVRCLDGVNVFDAVAKAKQFDGKSK